MTFSKASRTSVLAALLCLLLMGFAGASYGAIKFDVYTSPTEVINTGMSEVVGSLKFVVNGPDNYSGSNSGGDAIIGISYNAEGTHVTIDNTTSSGIRLFWSPAFDPATPEILPNGVRNQTMGNICYGVVEINISAGATEGTLTDGVDFVMLDGVRGRIATSTAVTQGADLYVKLASANDPSAYSFTDPAAIYRIATSYPGIAADVDDGGTSLLLCFPTTGFWGGGSGANNYIRVTEAFARAFVDMDANNDGNNINDRVDTEQNILGDPDNSTHIAVYLSSIPASVSGIGWDSSVYNPTSGAYMMLVSSMFSGSTAMAVYSYEAVDQVENSDKYQETFDFTPDIYIGDNQTDTGQIFARVSLYPIENLLACNPPENDNQSPDFAYVPQSDGDQSNTMPGGEDAWKLYANIIRCNCYMLFSYVAAQSGFDTGFAVANTSEDAQVFGPLGAPNQSGPITFFFYDTTDGYIGMFKTDIVEYGQTYVGLLSHMVDRLGKSSFSGYVIAQAEFQYCHAVSYIADSQFAVSAQGYAAMIIPDPAVKSGEFFQGRAPANAGDDFFQNPAGESLDN
jgi:hypothetical protein